MYAVIMLIQITAYKSPFIRGCNHLLYTLKQYTSHPYRRTQNTDGLSYFHAVLSGNSTTPFMP